MMILLRDKHYSEDFPAHNILTYILLYFCSFINIKIRVTQLLTVYSYFRIKIIDMVLVDLCISRLSVSDQD